MIDEAVTALAVIVRDTKERVDKLATQVAALEARCPAPRICHHEHIVWDHKTGDSPFYRCQTCGRLVQIVELRLVGE